MGSRKVRTVLAMLALSSGSVLSFDQLADELWAGKLMTNSRNALQANIARLRKLLESITGQNSDGMVRTVSNGYLLDLPADAVDTRQFLSLASRGAALLDSDPYEAINLLKQALMLWRGPALSDVADGERLQAAAMHLNERRLTAQEDLIAARLTVGEDRVVLDELKQLVAEHPGRERLAEYLMLALYRSGMQSNAIGVYHRTRSWLSLELGLEPGRALRDRYQAILVQDPALD